MAFVQELLQHYRAKVERRRRRNGKRELNAVGSPTVVDGGSEVDGDAGVIGNVGNAVDGLMATPIPRKSLSDADGWHRAPVEYFDQWEGFSHDRAGLNSDMQHAGDREYGTQPA